MAVMHSLEQLRGWWASRQGLTPSTAPKSIEDCVKTAGWLTASGAPTPYLSVRARMPGTSRAEIDRFVMDGTRAIEIPGLAGRPHLVVPIADMPVLLSLHALSYRAQLAKALAKDGVTEASLRAVASQVVSALDECPLSMSDLREAVTRRDAGILLRIALSDLMLRGIIRRFPSNGQLNSTDYQFELRHPDDRPEIGGDNDRAAIIANAVDLVLKHQGPMTIDEVCFWGDLTKGAARQALETIGAEAVSVSGWTTDKNPAWLRSADIAKWKSFKPESHDRIAFLPYRDPFMHLRRTPKVLTTATNVRVLDSVYDKQVPKSIDAVTELDHHVIAHGNQLAGIWEYDPKANAVVTNLWQPAAKLRRRVADAADDLTAFIRDELGDAKLSAVDPPARRVKRLAFLKQAREPKGPAK